METLQLGYRNGDWLPLSGMRLGFDCLMDYGDRYGEYMGEEYSDMDIDEMGQSNGMGTQELAKAMGYTYKMVNDTVLKNRIGQNMDVNYKFYLPNVTDFPYICSPEKKERCSSGLRGTPGKCVYLSKGI